MDLRQAVEYYLPHLVLAGDYALRIQSRVRSQATKENAATPLSQALTDADLSVQNMIEVATLARYPDVAFDPEEADKSVNLKYFPTDAPFLITLDPINGTAFYKDGLPIFDIIITILEGKRIVAAIVYLPAKGLFFIGIQGHGAFSTTKEGVPHNTTWSPFRLQPQSDIVLTYRCPVEVEEQLRQVLPVRDIQRDYHPRDWNFSINSILTGDITAFVKTQVQIIDWGAIAFIAELSGGVVSDLQGNPIPSYLDYPDRRIPNIVASSSRQVHERILAAIAQK